MKTRTTTILQILKFLALLAIIGFSIEAGSIIVSFIVSFYNPEAAKNIYKGLDFSKIKEHNVWFYYASGIFLVAISIMKVIVWQNVLMMLSKLNLTDPFQLKMIKLMERISYTLIAVWIFGLFYNTIAAYIIKETGLVLLNKIETDSFLFMAGLVYIISQVFRRGIELQSENELTV